jgi:hypothetical protein
MSEGGSPTSKTPDSFCWVSWDRLWTTGETVCVLGTRRRGAA